MNEHSRRAVAPRKATARRTGSNAESITGPAEVVPIAGRRSRTELRELLVRVGVERLLERGLQGGAAHILLGEVFKQAEKEWGGPISPASVYKRIWDSQSDFQRDVVRATASFYPEMERTATRRAIDAVMQNAAMDALVGRRDALRQCCRVIGDRYIEELESSRTWQLWVGIWALTVSTPTLDDDRDLGPSIQAGHEAATRELQLTLEHVVRSLGFRMRSHVSSEQLALAVGALAEGLALRNRFATVELRRVERLARHDADGDREAWTLFGVAIDALVESFCEPDPSFEGSAESTVPATTGL